MEDIATMLTDLITISVPTEVGENPGKTVSKIEEDLESYSNKFELFKRRRIWNSHSLILKRSIGK